MPAPTLSHLVRRLRRAAGPDPSPRTDRQLLVAFAADRDEAEIVCLDLRSR